jgi:hypothetical protein
MVAKPEGKIGDDARTTPLGLFNFAAAYRLAADTLHQQQLKITHATAPIRFLYYHATELYLKAFLRMHGHTPKELSSRKFGHRICCLFERASQLGFSAGCNDTEAMSLLANTEPPIRARYLETGFGQWPDMDELKRISARMHKSVGDALGKNGIPIRM